MFRNVSASPLCVPPLPTTGDPPPVHFMQAHPDVYSCVVKGCPLETKERLSTMTSPVHVDTVTQWLQTTRVLSYSWAVNLEQECFVWDGWCAHTYEDHAMHGEKIEDHQFEDHVHDDQMWTFKSELHVCFGTNTQYVWSWARRFTFVVRIWNCNYPCHIYHLYCTL